MDFAKIQLNKNEIPLRKTSAIPRLQNKQNVIAETIIPGRYEEENFKHPNKPAKKYKEDRESCFCNSCYNKTKNLCRFTLNKNLIRNLENEKEGIGKVGDQGSDESGEDDVNSTSLITDGESHCSEENCVNQIINQEYNRQGKTILSLEKTTANESDQLENSNSDKSQTIEFLHHTPTTIFYKEPKGSTKDLQKTSTGFDRVELKMRKDDELEKFPATPKRNYTTLRKSKTDSEEHIDSCLLKVSTRNRLKYTLTNVTKVHPNKQKNSLSKESSISSSRCVTPTELKSQKGREKFGELNVAELLDESNSKNCLQKQANLFSEDSNLDNYLCEREDNSLSHLFKTGNPWDNVYNAEVNKPKNSECVNEPNFEALVNRSKESKCDCLINALLEVFGNESHITQKIRNSAVSKYDTRFRNIRSAESYTVNADSDNENMTKVRTCRSHKSIENKKDQPKSISTCRKDDASIHTLSSLEKSLPEETYSSALCSTDTDFSKTSGTKYSKRETCISFKRCRCQNLKCYQLDELNESITSMQTEIKTLIKNIPYGKHCTCSISDEIAKLQLFYQECQQNEQKRYLQQKKLEYDIKEIYRKIDKLIETKRGPSLFKCFFLLPLIGILTVYTVSCLGELKKN